MTEATLLDDLNDAQRTAVRATTGPVVILAGAGTGKTTVISRRAAYAIATGVVPASDVLVVTFTDKAAGEMASRLASLGQPGVTARTFHAHALSQLSWFWPSRHDGAPMPEILASKIPIVGRLARSLPGGYRFTTAKDLADEIEWAKSRRIAPATYAAELRLPGRPDAADPGRALRPPLRRLRTGQEAGRPDRLRRHAHRDGRAARGGRGRPRHRPGAQALDLRRRVPGHEPPPGAAARAVARRSDATCASWATRTRRSTRSPARRATT